MADSLPLGKRLIKRMAFVMDCQRLADVMPDCLNTPLDFIGPDTQWGFRWRWTPVEEDYLSLVKELHHG